MRESKLEVAASVVWLVVAGLFGVVLVFHVKNHSFQYAHVSIEQRPGSAGGSGIYVNGMDLDEPLQRFGSDFNTHIDQLNEEKIKESWLLIVLDIVGLSTAFLSGVYELLKKRAAAARYSTAIVPAPVTATPPGKPPNKNADREHSIMAPPTTSRPTAIPEWSAFSLIGIGGLVAFGGYLTIRDRLLSRRRKQ